MSVSAVVVYLVTVSILSAHGNDYKSKLQDPAWQEVISQGGMHFGGGRLKRFIAINELEADEPHQECVLPNGVSGHCRHLRYCIQEKFKKDFFNFMEFVCVIKQESLGTCCPDNATRGGIQGLAGVLPASAKEEEREVAYRKSSLTDNRGCGISTRAQGKVSSQQANPREWPWMAFVMLNGLQHCGGVLITDTHVLTAAHCVQDSSEKIEQGLSVRLGEYDLGRDNDTRSYNYKVTEVRVNERYQWSNYMNDIAIIKLDRPAIFNTYVWPICLPPPGLLLTNKTATLIGWGTQFFGGPRATVLMEVSMPVWDLEVCRICFSEQIFEGNICAGGDEKDACQYDSGGPLMYQMASGRWVVVGLVSWGMRCGEPTHPGIYTAVDKYRAWIMENTRN